MRADLGIGLVLLAMGQPSRFCFRAQDGKSPSGDSKRFRQ